MELDISRITESSRIVGDLKPSFEEWTAEEYEQIIKYFDEKLKKGKMRKTKIGIFCKTSLYVGERNEKGNYHGIGRLLFNYGSYPEYYYIGEFVDGLEEGNGLYVSTRFFKGRKFNSYASVRREKGKIRKLNIVVDESILNITDNKLYCKINNLEGTGTCDTERTLNNFLLDGFY